MAFGHTLLLTPGEVVVEECGASVELEISLEDFIHWYGVGPDSDGFMFTQSVDAILERHSLALHRIFMIRDAGGSPLSSEPFHFHFDWPAENRITFGDLRSLRAKYRTRFSYPCGPRFLTFQLSMADENPGLFWQAVLRIHGTAEEDGRVLRLTSRGNTETIELVWNEKRAVLVRGSEGALACSGDGVAGLKQICADINIGKESVEVRISIPLALIQTWLSADRNNDEIVDQQEQKSVGNEMESLLARALFLEADGRKHSSQITGVAYLSLDAKDVTGASNQVSLHTGRVIARLRFGPFAALDQADFQWNLFNNAVLSVVANVVSDRAAVSHELSTFQPRFRWQGGS